MHTLSSSEKRTIRYAAIFLLICLVLLGGSKVWKFLSHRRADYLQMVAEARQLKSGSDLDTDQAAVVKRLMEDFQLDPAALSTNTVVADASAAIQKAATSGGVKLGAIRESAGRSSAKELATIQFEGSGPVAAVISLLHRLPLLGYPLLVDSVQITTDAMRPGQIKLSVTIIVQDFEQWKKTEATHA
ncbi:MAG TPA: hypothetical protein VIK53_07600 [Verrucomicrobiae bacterium]